jgi:hypothetical protein
VRAIGPSCLPHLVRGLQDSNADVWILALHELVSCPSSKEYADKIVAALIAGLADSSGRIRVHATNALVLWEPESHAAIPALIGALSDTDRDAGTSSYAAVRATGLE